MTPVILHKYGVDTKRDKKILTLRVMDGSPEKSSLVFEIAKFAAGIITFARREMSSSLSLNSGFFSILFLQFHPIL